MKDAIVFDLDGTLWDTVSAVVRSWNEVLDRRPEARALTAGSPYALSQSNPLSSNPAFSLPVSFSQER